MAPLLLALTLVAAGTGGAGGVGTIDAACAAPRGDEASPRIFVEMSGAVLPKARQGQWRELATESERRKLSEGERPPNTEAIVRDTRGGTLVSMYFQDASASWAHVVDYCFRRAGQLARLRGTFNSFTAAVAGTAAAAGPGIRRRRTIYYDARGAVLRTQTGVFDLDTDKPLPKAQFLDEEDPLYPTVRALPFSSDLLPPVAAAEPDPFAVAVRERLPAVKACFDRAAKKTPGVAGKAVGHWTVDTTGKVTDFAWRENQIESPVFASCAEKVIESWQFPARESAADVSFPFVFGGPAADLSLTP